MTWHGAAWSAKRLESLGITVLLLQKPVHDPFFPLLLAAQETENIDLVTSIAVAFSRTPMNLANIGHDLNSFSKGRFVLGLGFPNPAAYHQAIQHALVKASSKNA